MPSSPLFEAGSPTRRVKRQRAPDSEDEGVAGIGNPPTPGSMQGNAGPQTTQEEPNTGLSPEQLSVIRLAQEGHNHFITGGAGSGKTFTLTRIIQLLQNSGKTVLRCAPTGIAAYGIGGTTIHSLFGFDPSKPPDPIRRLEAKAWSGPVHERLRCADVLVIDEISMVDKPQMDRMNRMAQVARGQGPDQPSDLPFGGLQIMVCGDCCQLPPVKPGETCFTDGGLMNPRKVWVEGVAYLTCPKCPVHEDPKKQFAFNAAVWNDLNLVYTWLQTNHRQSQPEFIQILDKLRDGTDLDQDDRDLISNKAGEPRDVEGAVTIAATNRVVDRINEREYKKLLTREVRYNCLDHVNIRPDHAEQLADFEDMSADGLTLQKLTGHHYKHILNLKEGMKVLLRSNIDVSKGLVNGAQGIIKGFEAYDEATIPMPRAGVDDPDVDARGRPTTVRLKFSAAQLYRHERAKEFITAANPGIKLPIVEFNNGQTATIFPDCALEQHGEPAPHSFLSRTQIPLIQGDAMTIHKSQGLTLDRVIVDVSDIFGPAMAYVALSRVRNLRGLTVIGNLQNLNKYKPIEEVTEFLRTIRRHQE